MNGDNGSTGTIGKGDNWDGTYCEAMLRPMILYIP